MPSVLAARDIYFTYNVSITPAKSLFQVGETVHWQLSAAVVGPTRGIASFSVALIESRGEQMEILPTGQVPTWIYPGVYVWNFRSPEDEVYGYFTYKNYFQADGAGGDIVSVGASQFVHPTDTKNFPKALDKFGGELCEGQYTPTKTGFHDLSPVHAGGTVWIRWILGNTET